MMMELVDISRLFLFLSFIIAHQYNDLENEYTLK